MYRILIVEDRPPWRRALEAAYRNLMGPDCHIECADSKEGGLMALRSRSGDQRFDLLSLDVNLKHSESIQHGLSTGPWGLDLVEEAASKKLAHGCLLISAAAHDEELEDLSVPKDDGTNVLEIRATLAHYGIRWFGEDHWHYIGKPRIDDGDDRVVADVVDNWLAAGILSRELLLRLSKGEDALPKPYKILLNGVIATDGRLRSASVNIRSMHEHFRNCAPASVLSTYVELFVALVRCAQFGTHLENHEIVRLLPGKRPDAKSPRSETAKTQVIRHLRDSCRVDPAGILRVGDGGLVLADDVTVVGSLARAVHPPYELIIPREDSAEGESRNVTIKTNAVECDMRFPQARNSRILRGADAAFLIALCDRRKFEIALASKAALSIFGAGATDDFNSDAQAAVASLCHRLLNHPNSIDPLRVLESDSAGWRLCSEVVVKTRRGRKSRGPAEGMNPDDVALYGREERDEWDDEAFDE